MLRFICELKKKKKKTFVRWCKTEPIEANNYACVYARCVHYSERFNRDVMMRTTGDVYPVCLWIHLYFMKILPYHSFFHFPSFPNSHAQAHFLVWSFVLVFGILGKVKREWTADDENQTCNVRDIDYTACYKKHVCMMLKKTLKLEIMDDIQH